LITNFASWAWTAMFLIYAALCAVGLWIAFRHVPETWQKPQQVSAALTPVIQRTKIQQFINAVPQQLWLLAAIVVFTSTAKSGLEPVLIQFVLKTVTENAALIALAYLPSAVVFAFLQSRLGSFRLAYASRQWPPACSSAVCPAPCAQFGGSVLIHRPIRAAALVRLLDRRSDRLQRRHACRALVAIVRRQNRGSFGLHTARSGKW
jgi:hypothetical protein